MSISRIFQAVSLQAGETLNLNEEASHHLARVLRAKVNDELTLFNGEGGEYSAIIMAIHKKTVTVKIRDYIEREAESSLELYLAQGISRGEKMDYTIQKAVELGVTKILPLFTERSTVKLDHERREKRLQHWRSIAIGACEQSGRNRVPEILLPDSFSNGLTALAADWRLVLSPKADRKLKEIPIEKNQRVILLIGPEGGLSETEIEEAHRAGFLSLNLGPRILRTETAAVAAIAALQCCFGDLN